VKIQIVNARPVKVPIIAPFAFENGIKIPRQNSPKRGPPSTPKSDKADLHEINHISH
jgi:hypothetical protein